MGRVTVEKTTCSTCRPIYHIRVKQVRVDLKETRPVNTVNTRLKLMGVKRVQVEPSKHDPLNTVNMTEMTILPLLWKTVGVLSTFLPSPTHNPEINQTNH